MNIELSNNFEKDVLKIRDKKLSILLNEVIEELENCINMKDISHIKKMKGTKNLYRIRIGGHRLGCELIDSKTIILLRFMDRKDIYKYFP